VAQHVADHLVIDAQAALAGLAVQGGGLLLVAERLDLIDHGLADARAQIFAQLQFQRRCRAGEEQRQPGQAGRVEGAEEGDLGRLAEPVDVVDDEQPAGRAGQLGAGFFGGDEGDTAAGLFGGGAGGLQQVAAAAAARPPQIDRIEGARLGHGAQARHQLGVGAGDEIVEGRIPLGPDVERQLLGHDREVGE
jgi:hypothetical protein